MDNDTNTIPESPENRSLLARIFISPDEPRLRAGWRILVEFIFLVVIVFFIGFLAQLLIQYGLNEYLGSIIVVLGITTSVFMGRRFLDRRSFVSLGLKLNTWTLMDLFVGFAIGVLVGLVVPLLGLRILALQRRAKLQSQLVDAVMILSSGSIRSSSVCYHHFNC